MEVSEEGGFKILRREGLDPFIGCCSRGTANNARAKIDHIGSTVDDDGRGRTRAQRISIGSTGAKQDNLGLSPPEEQQRKHHNKLYIVGQATKLKRREVLEKAWIGDAVLSLYARMRILNEGAGIDNEKAIRMTSNKFLQIIGEASEVEARIGVIYERDGLEAAFAWIELELMPLHEKQERRIAPPPRVKSKV